jgi:murein DD-endopeptidase MepM/ murein hydrolase activator NlpD
MVTYSRVSTVEPTPSVNAYSHGDERSIIESCISPIPVAKQYSEGCGGGCVSLGFETPRTCNYEGPHDCIGTIKQKITRYTLSPDYLNYKRHQIDDSDSQPEFIWPLQGQIIQVFSAGNNDGINISTPEGTEVKATEGGEVAYADHELADYGDMVLIRHPNGFVSAYAHNSELMVGKGDKVKRGQVIAKSGKSGKADLPQLHFELRKGSTPVNPILFLAKL